MATTTLVYTANVYVTVEDGEVTQVVVDDEDLTFAYCLEAADALRVASKGDWPAWEFGV